MAEGGGNMALSVLLRAVDNISGPVRRVQGRLGAFRRQAQAIGRRVGFERLTSSLSRAGRAGQDLYHTAGRITRRLTLLGGIGAAALGGITTATASSGDELAKFADQLGMGVEELQEWQYAAERMGVSQGKFNSSLQAFVKRVGEARDGEGELRSRIEDTNPQLLEQLMAAENTGEALRVYMRALEGADDELQRNQLAAAAFSRSGMEMTRMVRDGTEEIDALRARASELGHVMDEATARQAERFTDKMTDMQKSMLGMRNVIGGALMPVFGDLMDRLTTLIVEHQPAVREWAETFAERLPGRLAMLRDEFTQLLERLQPAIDLGMTLVDQFGAMNTAAGALALVIGGPLIVPVVKLVAALASVGVALGQVSAALIGLAAKAIPAVLAGLKALAVAAMAHPVLAIVTAIAGGAALLIANWDRVGPWFRGLWESLTGYVSRGWEAIKSVLAQDPLDLMIGGFRRAREWLSNVDWAAAARAGWSALKELFRWSPLGLLTRGFGQAREWLANVDWAAAAAASWTALKTLFRWSPLGIMQDAFGRAVSWLGEIDWSEHGRRLLGTLVGGIREMASKPVDAVRGVLGRIRNLLPFSDAKEGPLSSLTQSGRALVETLAGGVESGRSALLDTLRDVAAAAKDALGGAWDTLTGWFGGGDGAQGQHDGSVTVPESEMGGGPGSLDGIGAAGGGITVQRVDFRPQVTIEARDAETAEQIADLIDQRLERWSRRDLWVQIQGVQEAES
ncbi:hypothetical protein NYO91_07395 [Arhodomonas aquaeolei]|uniref:hypothetical protein n=1 Tax=Arhodomonas aquaeolei TaxID=2369 RepID=UPI002167342F|nr:hypothetical protein [Arhodomonas aquaeolei]MCS4503901.1 hypothetical protein [Arhodomonas aquaeolei]